MAYSRNLKYRSYWRSRRDIECSVDAHEFDGDDSIQSIHNAVVEHFGISSAETNSETDVVIEANIESHTLSQSQLSESNMSELISQSYGDEEMPDDQDDANSCVSLENNCDLFDSGSFDCDSTSASSDDDLSDGYLSDELGRWINHILHPYHPNLPLESRTLLHTTRAVTVKDMSDGGTYSYIGITKYLQQIFMTHECVIIHV